MLLNNVKEEILNCRACSFHFGFEPRPIYFGRADSKIMQISQAPSKYVHASGIPFDDASGKRLRQEWYQIKDADFYNADHFYITSLAHCYPGKDHKGRDRNPPAICYTKWVKKEIALVHNHIYIIIGAQAASIIFPNIPFTDLVFHDQLLNGKPAYVLPHPSPLNFRWLHKHPTFLETRIPIIRHIIKSILKTD